MMLGMGLSAQITLGSGTSTSYFPVYPYYGYTYTQQIFPKTEINANAAGNITGLKFYCGTSTSLTNSDNWTVYVGTTTKTSFASDADWVPASSLTQVFSGTVTNNAGVVEITFITPFSYDNINNLVVAVDENKADYNTGSTGNFYSYTSTSNSAIYYASDSNNPDPFAPPSGTRMAKKSNMTIIGLAQSLLPACPVVSAPSNGATDVTNLPVINWSATPNATGYRLTMGTTPGGTDVMNNVDLGNVTSYTFTTSLLYGKQYYYTLNAYSVNGTSTGCSQLSFTTKNIGCPTITAPISNATGISSTPTIEWSAVTDAIGYRISVGTTAGGTDILNNSDIGNVTSYTFSIPLAGGTKYYYTVNAYTTNNISASCVEKNFTTACSNAITTLPWAENFDGLTAIGSGIVPTCWSTTVGTSNWSSMNANSVSYNAPKSTPNYMAIPYGNTAASQLWTPGFNLTAGTTYEFSFYYNTNGTTSSYVGFSGDVLVNNVTDAGTAASLGTFITSTQGTGSYTLYKVFYTPTATDNYYFAVNVSSNGSPWYLGVDDFKLQVAPTCLEPTNIVSANATTTTVDVSWTAPGTSPANGYDLYYSTNNTAPLSTTNPNYTAINGTSKTVSGLAPATSYYVWVRSRCSGTDQSAWAGPLLISTAITNDDCANPVALTLGGDFAANAITGSNNGATTDGTPMSCQSNSINNVWYSVVVPASGNLTIETKGVTGSTYTDSIINVFSGSCGSLTEILCDDDSGDGNFSKVTLTGQTPGATLLVSIWRYGAGTGTDGQFQVSAYDASILATNETSNAKNTIKVYPNPFADVLNISEITNVKAVLVTDFAGRLMKTITNPVSSLYLGELKSGMYLVTLKMKDGSNQTVKIIKK
jgi:hypothetical protein